MCTQYSGVKACGQLFCVLYQLQSLPCNCRISYTFQNGDKMLPVVIAEQSLERRGMHLPDRYANNKISWDLLKGSE